MYKSDERLHSDECSNSGVNNDYDKHAAEYAELGMQGTFYLAFRDIPQLLQKYITGKKALDYGCGSGRSTRFLKSLGFDTVGVDISHAMFKQACLKDESGEYHQIQSGQLPFEDRSFDLIFSSISAVMGLHDQDEA